MQERQQAAMFLAVAHLPCILVKQWCTHNISMDDFWHLTGGALTVTVRDGAQIAIILGPHIRAAWMQRDDQLLINSGGEWTYL